MVLTSMLRRATPRAALLAIRAVGSSRVLDGAISAVDGSVGFRSSILSHRIFTASNGNFVQRMTPEVIRQEQTDREMSALKQQIKEYEQMMKADMDERFRLAVKEEIIIAQRKGPVLKPWESGIPQSKFNFQIQDNLGQRCIFLKRVFSNENIEIKVDMPWEFEEASSSGTKRSDDEQDEIEAKKFAMCVTVYKETGLSLVCKITASADDIVSIDNILIKEKKKTKELPVKHIEYRLPDAKFSSSSGFNETFFKFLEIRGITPKTIQFLYKYLVTKQQRERVPVLTKLEKFVRGTPKT